MSTALIHENKRARFDYETIESFEAGIKLSWAEVASIRRWNLWLKGCHVSLSSGKPILMGCHIGIPKNHPPGADWNPTKERELFLKKKTISFLQWKIREKWLTVIALKAYFKGNLIKIEVWLVRGKSEYDKRHVLKNRVLEREAKSAMSVRFR